MSMKSDIRDMNIAIGKGQTTESKAVATLMDRYQLTKEGARDLLDGGV
jgi:predicted SpoU family rRNA methylase